MNISSVVVQARPERLAEVRASLAALPGVEVHGESPEGKLVLTLEDDASDSTRSAADRYVALNNIPGVLSAAMIYQFSDEISETEEA